MAACRRTRCCASASSPVDESDESHTVAWRRSGSTSTPVTVTSSRRSSSMRSSSSATTSCTTWLTLAVRGYRRSGIFHAHGEVDMAFEHVHLGERPREPLHSVQHLGHMRDLPSHGREPQLAPLPFVLEADLGGRHLIAAPRAFEDRFDDRPLLLEGVDVGQAKL